MLQEKVSRHFKSTESIVWHRWHVSDKYRHKINVYNHNETKLYTDYPQYYVVNMLLISQSWSCWTVFASLLVWKCPIISEWKHLTQIMKSKMNFYQHWWASGSITTKLVPEAAFLKYLSVFDFYPIATVIFVSGAQQLRRNLMIWLSAKKHFQFPLQ